MNRLALLFFYVLGHGLLQGQTAGQLSSSGGAGTGYSQALVNQVVGDASTQIDVLAQRTGIDEFAGSPYVNDSFELANVYYENDLMDKLYYRYNALNEEIELKKTSLSDETPQRLVADKAIHLDVDGNELSFKTFIDSKKNTLNGYLYLLVDGQTYDLYRRVRMKFTEGQKAQNSFVMAVPNRFTPFIEYYYQKAGIDRIDELKNKNGSLLKILPNDKKNQLKRYLKDNELNVKDEKDMIKAFEFLNGSNGI